MNKTLIGAQIQNYEERLADTLIALDAFDRTQPKSADRDALLNAIYHRKQYFELRLAALKQSRL